MGLQLESNSDLDLQGLSALVNDDAVQEREHGWNSTTHISWIFASTSISRTSELSEQHFANFTERTVAPFKRGFLFLQFC